MSELSKKKASFTALSQATLNLCVDGIEVLNGTHNFALMIWVKKRDE